MTILFLYVIVTSIDPVTCLVRFAAIAVNLIASVCNLLLVTIDRYVAISYPFFYHSRGSLPGSLYLIIFTWLFSVTGGLTFALWHNQTVFCDFVMLVKPAYFIVFFASTVYVGIVIMAVLYSRIFLLATKHKRLIEDHVPTAHANVAKLKNDYRFSPS